MKLQVIPSPKPMRVPKVAAPKLAAVHVSKIGGGYKVQHIPTHGPKPVPFVFSDPNRMLSHLNRIQRSQWREPERDEANKITPVLGIGQAV